MNKRLEFWFDFASTYSYVAMMRIEEQARECGVDIDYKPFLLGPIFAKQDLKTSPFKLYPVKGAYMLKDVERICKLNGLSFALPESFPAHSVLAARVALVGLDETWGVAFCKEVFCAEFAHKKDIKDQIVISSLLQKMNLDPEVILERALSQDNKDRLRRQTERAMALGIFGAPSFTTPGEELYWGNDRLEMALDAVK